MASRSGTTESHPFGAAVADLVDQFAKLPGIGRKTADRLTHYILRCEERDAFAFADAIRQVRRAVHPCTVCFNLTDSEVCRICSDPRREKEVVCVVEQSPDVPAIEESGVFCGVYHVLGGRISPLDGVGPEDLHIDSLVRRVRRDGVKELVMATNPTVEGDGTALFITNLLENDSIRITRLARGIASGSVLEFANREMLADAIRGRQEI